mgnify:FL=1|jgi:chromate transporter
MLWQLFLTFAKIGFVSFGGGYAMIPVIEKDVVGNGWLTAQQFSQVVSLAGMTPGPSATNMATVIGYLTAGVPGAFVAVLGTLLPSLIIIIALCLFIARIRSTNVFESVFYGLRPVVAGLIIYAAIFFAGRNGLMPAANFEFLSALAIFAAALLCFGKFRMHPLLVILACGAVGMIIYV